MIYLLGAAVYAFAFGAFYLKYVPLIPGFQGIFLPVGLLLAGLTALKPAAGALAFLGAFPLVSHWPYFFGVEQSTPHAPAAAVLALFLFFGWLLRGALASWASRQAAGPPVDVVPDGVLGPLRAAAAAVAVSAVFTFWKWTHFFPLRANGFYELTANVNGVSAGGARMSTVFAALSYLAGFALFAFLRPVFRDRRGRAAAASVLGASLLAASAFGLFQAAVDPSLGNTRFWTVLKQINATFKDPNAFAAVITGLWPFFLGAALAFGRGRRALFGGALALSLAVFPFIGVRSALLGLGAAVAAGAVFWFFDRERGRRAPKKDTAGDRTDAKRASKRPFAWAAGAVLGLLAVAAGFGLLSGSRLFERMKAGLGRASTGGGIVGLSPERYFLWREAVRMMADYPLTGVGMGGYVIEVPNYYERDRTEYPAGFEGWRRVDSAENYFLQAGAEMGLPGLAAVGLLFAAVGREAGRGFKRRGRLGRDRFLLYGASAGLLSLAFNMLFHSYLASFETQFVFWTLAAFVSAVGRGDGGQDDGRDGGPRRRSFGRKAVRAAVVGGLLAYAGAAAWAQFHSLSIADKTREFGLQHEFGLYPPERTEDGRPFHWTRKEAGVTVRVGGPVM
ncbi:MAG: O-antigen ligase family protein, partial [Candidatus Aminicenantes bacterium]|nr:O-antigen ligase family protein [Candidatus Aminicenantes bacterium]